jgi:hypothetical protein
VQVRSERVELQTAQGARRGPLGAEEARGARCVLRGEQARLNEPCAVRRGEEKKKKVRSTWVPAGVA